MNCIELTRRIAMGKLGTEVVRRSSHATFGEDSTKGVDWLSAHTTFLVNTTVFIALHIYITLH